MKRILLLGAGRSASALIKYLLDNAINEKWLITIGDISITHLDYIVGALPYVDMITFDIHNEQQRSEEIGKADLVISLLPAQYHIEVARECLVKEKNMITASYVSPAFLELHQEAQDKNLTILMESGLDPGIDHMSAMAIIERIHEQGGQLTSFKSFTGGLVAPESDNNPWHYKFTWNPRNVVLAGQGTAKYIKQGEYKYIPYHKLYKRTDTFQVDGYGEFEGYANRDSLSYREPYGLMNIPTMLRGTLRRPGYCEAWDIFVQLGLTDDTYTLDNSEALTYGKFLETFLPPASTEGQSLAARLQSYLGVPVNGELMQKLEWLGLFSDTPVNLAGATPAQVLEKILKEKWTLASGDKDMIVMQHIFEYGLAGETHEIVSSLVATGDDEIQTAMAKTVGLPVGILAKLMLQNKISKRGIVIPIHKEIYQPVLDELKDFEIDFIEKKRRL